MSRKPSRAVFGVTEVAEIAYGVAAQFAAKWHNDDTSLPAPWKDLRAADRRQIVFDVQRMLEMDVPYSGPEMGDTIIAIVVGALKPFAGRLVKHAIH